MRSLLFALQALVFTGSVPVARETTEFAKLVAQLSENGGFFDSDNLVSNETSYLHVLPALESMGIRGGAYLGVGPEQNFSYLAEIRPELAIMIDIRRDNMLLHLLFKAIFERARNRLDYLCLLYGRPVPADLPKWTDRPLDDILMYLDLTPGDSGLHAANHRSLMERVTAYGVPLTDTDRATIRRFHGEFAALGLELRYTSLNRPSRPNYPSERDLYLATDMNGRRGNYLTTEERFRVVQELERGDRIVPAVGDLSGTVALKAIAQYLAERKLTVSALYVSNVEMYLFRNGTFAQFAANVRSLPSSPSSVIIRSSFGRGGWRGPDPFQQAFPSPIPQPLPGHLSAQLLQPFPAFLKLTAQPDSATYLDLLMNSLFDFRVPQSPPPGRRRRRLTGCVR
ncbi:MAG: hypothetical protein HOP28_01630 [Gemmatimonadales bacterium]|nr:hypothetical protein [Gemmatimonadales bacterium]